MQAYKMLNFTYNPEHHVINYAAELGLARNIDQKWWIFSVRLFRIFKKPLDVKSISEKTNVGIPDRDFDP